MTKAGGGSRLLPAEEPQGLEAGPHHLPPHLGGKGLQGLKDLFRGPDVDTPARLTWLQGLLA